MPPSADHPGTGEGRLGARREERWVTHHVTFRASPVLLAKLEQLAETRGQSRSAAVKAAIVAAAAAEHNRPQVPDEREVLELLTSAARGGSVAG
jgi:predicted transcriptional regulator